MGTKILIVEDQFIEANDLRMTLESAGHTVSGIAKSFDHAILLLERDRPDIVLLDIFLKGKLTGLDLAVVLSRENIPFIYLSANSNASTFDAAKATRPYGFLVKPFREKDVLIALDIASYRHSHTAELLHNQERLLSDILCSIISEKGTPVQKLLLVVKAFKPYIPFDYAYIDMDVEQEDLNAMFCFHRTGYDAYEYTNGWQMLESYGLRYNDYNAWRKSTGKSNVIRLENGGAFEDTCVKVPFLDILKKKFNVHSRLVVPLLFDGVVHMAIRFYSEDAECFNTDHVELLSPLKALLSVVLESIRKENANAPVVSSPVVSKVEASGPGPIVDGIVGKSPKLLHALDQMSQVAAFDMSVLVLGETGVGKEGLVKAIHQLSGRSKKPFVKINCAAIPSSLIESELFGHEKGAFTGASERRIGKFEQANGGTIFLDEIGEIPLEVQTKLLRVLQEREVERIGGRSTVKVDVRVVAATNRNLHKDVADGKFRMDLYYRINVFPIILPPLRDRKEDIPLLIEHFLSDYSVRTKTLKKEVSAGVIQKLMAYSWPGNIRELQYTVERNIVMSGFNMITAIELPDEDAPIIQEEDKQEGFQSIAEVDKAHIIAALKKCNGRVSGKGGAAEILNIPATTLNSKMKKLGISWKFIY